MHQIILRGFWRRWMIVLFLCIATIIVIIVVIAQQAASTPKKKLNDGFIWLDLNNMTHLLKCRNSKQGPYLIADEKGHVCHMTVVQHNGCCNPHENSTERYLCTSCQVNRCCRIFEHCVSCCMQPHKRNLLEKVLLQAQNSRNPLLRLVKDSFELCLHKCRTSSTSVLRGNTYRDSLYKYCYGVDAPQLLGTASNSL